MVSGMFVLILNLFLLAGLLGGKFKVFYSRVAGNYILIFRWCYLLV